MRTDFPHHRWLPLLLAAISTAHAAPSPSELLSASRAIEAQATEPSPRMSLGWLGAQVLLPSPGVYAGPGGGGFDLRWQFTPVLYSWGLNRKLQPWRFGIVEPLTRSSGSVELHISPEHSDRWLVRAGARAYFPLLHRGDYLGFSLGTAWTQKGSEHGLSYDAGLNFLFGMMGVHATYTPVMEADRWVFTFRLRWF